MHIDLATGPVSWGVWYKAPSTPIPWRQFLDEVVIAGYGAIELGIPGYLPEDEAVLGRELKARGIKIAGSALVGDLESIRAWPGRKPDIDRLAHRIAVLGGSYLILIPALYTDLSTRAPSPQQRADPESWQRLLETSTAIADHVRSRWDLHVVIHPHADTHLATGDTIDRFLADTDPAALSLCLDVGHSAYHGDDPIAIYRRHYTRIRYLHLKAVDRNMVTRIRREKIPFFEAVRMGVFTEPQVGAVDFASLLRVLAEHDYDGWAVVEQDLANPPPFRHGLAAARRTREFLREAGYC